MYMIYKGEYMKDNKENELHELREQLKEARELLKEFGHGKNDCCCALCVQADDWMIRVKSLIG